VLRAICRVIDVRAIHRADHEHVDVVGGRPGVPRYRSAHEP
jgi:hypothetical protein